MTADEVIGRLAADPAGSGLFLDFDGTLAPIVDEPEAARMPDRLRPVLAGLAEGLGTVAVVSGRPAAFLVDEVAVPGVRLLGLYGLQEAVDGEVAARPEAEEWRAAVEDARGRLRWATSGMAGVVVEDKELSVAVHWRHARDRDEAERDLSLLVAAVAADTGLAREPGKFVEELRPPVPWDKGAAVDAVADELSLSTVCYLGDDLGDVVAFRAVRALGGIPVGVAHGDETPADLRAAVDLMLDGTQAVADWLVRLRDALNR